MRIAVVVPRYGQDILGGAESQARGFANEAVRRNWTVEMWTTCARSHYDWENVFSSRLCRERGNGRPALSDHALGGRPSR